MSNPTEQNKGQNILTKILDLLKYIFGQKREMGQEISSGTGNKIPSEFSLQAGLCQKELFEKVQDALKNDDPVKAYMFESQRAMLGVISDQVAKGREINSNLTDSDKNQILNNVMDKWKDIKDDPNVQDAFQDYHNHDKELLSNLKSEVDKEFNQILNKSGMEFKEALSAIGEDATDSVVEHMTQVPETPAQKAGISKDLSLENSKENERKMERNNDNDMNSPSMAP